MDWRLTKEWSRRLVTVQWEYMCKSVDEQGIRSRNLIEFNQASVIKMAWNFWKGEKPWCTFVRSRFCTTDRPIRHYKASPVWQGIKMGLLSMAKDTQVVFGRLSKSKLWFDNWFFGRASYRFYVYTRKPRTYTELLYYGFYCLREMADRRGIHKPLARCNSSTQGLDMQRKRRRI